MKILVAASIAFAVAYNPAEAAIPVPVMKVRGANFYAQCTRPPADRGVQFVGLCAAYVAGIADDLKDAGHICLAPGVTPHGLLPFALNWIRLHPQHSNRPAAIQIRNGLMAIFPCQTITRTAQKEQNSLGDVIKLGENFLHLWTEAKPFIIFLSHL